MEQTEFSETSAYKIQTPGSYPEENIQHKNPHDIRSPNRDLYLGFAEYKARVLSTRPPQACGHC